jgi:hypothetical protein
MMQVNKTKSKVHIISFYWQMSIKDKQFCDVTPYNRVEIHQRLGVTGLSPP